ncbi:hypothetical protein JB92DRAFT_3134427 [Gautieria morchelliformis]|nr:hypothetical protein JB92DRAFT_3134427 [Gautieria morchelliformis]
MSRNPTQNTMAQMYTMHPSFTTESPEHFTFPPAPRHASSGKRISTPDHRVKPESPPTVYPFSPSQRRASTPNTMLSNPYDSRLHHMSTETHRSRRVDNKFPGPLRIPPTPRFFDTPSPSPHDSPASTLVNTPSNSEPFRSPSPDPLPSWRDTSFSAKLPPIRRAHPSSGHNLPHLSSARWHDDPYPLKPSPRFLETPSPTRSSPEVKEVTMSKHPANFPSSSRREYPSKSESSMQR